MTHEVRIAVAGCAAGLLVSLALNGRARRRWLFAGHGDAG